MTQDSACLWSSSRDPDLPKFAPKWTSPWVVHETNIKPVLFQFEWETCIGRKRRRIMMEWRKKWRHNKMPPFNIPFNKSKYIFVFRWSVSWTVLIQFKLFLGYYESTLSKHVLDNYNMLTTSKNSKSYGYKRRNMGNIESVGENSI